MPEENFMLVRRIGHAVRDGLGPYVLGAYKFKYTKKKYLEVLQETLRREHPFDSHDQVLESLDLQAWLNAMEFQWKEVFSRKLGHTAREAERDTNISRARSFVNELRRTRNMFSHEAPRDEFTDEDVYRIADTASRLLRAVKKRDKAAITEEIKKEFGVRLYSAEAEASQTEPVQDNLSHEEIEELLSEEQPPESTVEDESAEREIRVDLSGLKLSDMDLRDRNLGLANLIGADLSGSNLQDVDLTNKDLSNVKLSKSNLTWAKLGNSNLSHADLSETQLQFADLRNADFSYAKMERSSLLDAKMDHTVFSHANLAGSDMRISLPWDVKTDAISVELYDNVLPPEFARKRLDFSHAILREVKMPLALLDRVNLTHADLTGADFTGTRFDHCELNDAILNSANLSNCEILGCDFSGAKLNNVNLSEVGYCVHTLFRNAEMSGANLENIFIDEGNIDMEYHWDNVNLSGANLSGAILPRQSFRNANLEGAVFRDAYLRYADFSNADLNETDFTGADLTCADFTGARFYLLSTILPDGSYWDEDTDMTKFTGPAT